MVDIALLTRQDQEDRQFFFSHPDRYAHIREPVTTECRGEFWKIGSHDPTRRRILLWRVPKENPHYDPRKPALLKIPFLAFADETIEDTDEVLLPIIDNIMRDARARL